MNEYLPEQIKNDYRSLRDYGHVTPALSCDPNVTPRKTDASIFISFTNLIQDGEEENQNVCSGGYSFIKSKIVSNFYISFHSYPT